MAGRANAEAKVALVTGGSQGLGLALVEGLAGRGWSVVTDARRAEILDTALRQVDARDSGRAIGVPGDVTDPAHREDLVRAARDIGRIDLIVNNASTLGESPLPRLDAIEPETMRDVFETNVIAPMALVRSALEHLAPNATIVDITSDAGVEPYEGWGGYGSSKAALEHAGAVLAVEHPELRVLTVDPGDMRTQMHQRAFPGEDISDRPEPHESVPGLLALIEGDAPSGRYETRNVVAAASRPS
jgi:NAD(P)-dependent dehydrogenase (short-subunit alcohol dehydrogenase family)